MTLTQLEYAVAVANYQSFVAAAEKCFVTQPTLSMQIQKLEDELGVRLFDRTKHPIAITEAGESIIAQARIAIAQADKIGEIVQGQQGSIAGPFRLAVIPSVAPYILPHMLAGYSEKHPEVRLKASELETAAAMKALRNGEIDAALVSTPLSENNLREYPIFYEPLVGYFPEGDPALEKRLITPDDIRLDRLWLLAEGHCMRNQVLDLCSEGIQKQQAEKPYYYESGNVETLRRLVDTVGGLTVLPELAISDFDEDRIARVRYFEGPEPVREIGLVTVDHFVRMGVLNSLIDAIGEMVPQKMRVQNKTRKVLRVQSAKLSQ